MNHASPKGGVIGEEKTKKRNIFSQIIRSTKWIPSLIRSGSRLDLPIKRGAHIIRSGSRQIYL